MLVFAGGVIGTDIVVKSPADGYTICMLTVAQSISPSIYNKLGFDPIKDFAPVTLMATLPSLLMVHPSLPVKNVKDLVALAKAKPGVLTYASTGNGTSPHMMMEMFKSMAAINMVHVPYKGSSEGVVAVTRGDVNLMFANLPPALALIKDGRVRPIAVTTAQRLPAFPDLPTVAESGVPGFEVSTWFALFAPELYSSYRPRGQHLYLH